MRQGMYILNLYVENVYGQAATIRRLREEGFGFAEDKEHLHEEALAYFPDNQMRRIDKYIFPEL